MHSVNISSPLPHPCSPKSSMHDEMFRKSSLDYTIALDVTKIRVLETSEEADNHFSTDKKQ